MPAPSHNCGQPSPAPIARLTWDDIAPRQRRIPGIAAEAVQW